MIATSSASSPALPLTFFMTKQWASAKDAAKQLSVSQRTLLRWRQKGWLIPGIHFKRIQWRGLVPSIVYNVKAVSNHIDHHMANELEEDEPRALAP
jgi:hypothetical protein